MPTIQALDPRWIQGALDDPEDQCAHGRLAISVDGIEMVSARDGDLTLSGAAFYLLRTLESSHTAGHSVAGGNVLLPCCAFNAWPAGDNGSLILLGCGGGVDLSVEHLPDHRIRVSRDALSATIDFADWRMAVIRFARQIEAFYASSSPKSAVEDDFDRKGWELFWAEWHTLVEKHGSAL